MKTSTAIKKLSAATALAAISASTVAISKAEAAIIQVDPADLLNLKGIITFGEVTYTPPNDPDTGNNYDNIFFARDWSYETIPVINPNPNVGVNFAERFVGQALSYNGDFDVLSGDPSGQLALQVGLPNDNVNVWKLRQVLSGLGPTGFPNSDAIGEGAIAILFPRNQSEFGFETEIDTGPVNLSFFGRDGSSLGNFVINTDGDYAFMSDSGQDIAGVAITNLDPNGIWIDNIVYDNPGEPPAENIPEPSSVLGLLALGALGGSLKLKSKLKS